MSRRKFWAYLKDENGRPIPSASINLRLDEGPLAQLYTTSASANGDELDQDTLTTDVSGYFEFFIGDVYEQGTGKVGYDPDQEFTILWTSVDGEKAGTINDLQMFYQLFPVDATDQYSSIKNKLASNAQTYSWSTHRQQTWFHEIHQITALDWAASPNEGTYNKVVSNEEMYRMKNLLIALQVSGGEGVTIESSGAVSRGFDIASGSWVSGANGLYYSDVNHGYNSQYPVVQVWCKTLSCMQYPAEVEFTDNDNLRVYVDGDSRGDMHIICVSQSDAIIIDQNPTLLLNSIPVTMTVEDMTVSAVTSGAVLLGTQTMTITQPSASVGFNASPSASLLPLTITQHSMTTSGGTEPLPPGAFVMTLETSEANEDFIMPLNSNGVYDFTVDWGDGSSDYITTYDDAARTHTYSSSGTHTITVTGNDFTGFKPTAQVETTTQVRDIKQWGLFGFLSGFDSGSTFSNCVNLTCSATDSPLPASQTGCTYFYRLFNGCTSFNGDVSGWDVDGVSSMDQMFVGCENFNSDMNSWNVSACIDMSSMFYGCDIFNGNISDWDVSNVADFAQFLRGTSFSGCVSGWNVSSCTDMRWMFAYSDFEGTGGLDQWDTSSLTQMSDMFIGCSSFNTDVSNFDISGVSDISSVFDGCSSFDQDISGWDISSVTDMNGLFNDCSSFNQDLSTWDVSSVTDLNSMFAGCSTFNQPVSGWTTTAATNMGGMFYNASAFNQDLSGWDLVGVTNVWNMLANTSLSSNNYDSILNGWAAQSVTSSLTLHATPTKYSTTGQTGRNTLTTTYSWTINDGGLIT